MQTEKLLQNKDSQPIRLPNEFRFKGDDVLIKEQGEPVMLVPTVDPWQPLIDSLALFSDDFMESRE